MKILEIHIYGYGKLENMSIRELSNFSVFYGKNEAGKSTIMAFIHSILFGFPTKQQSELRYEPKKSSKYGGKLVVSFPEKGRVTIERVKGKAAGDVTVILEDGTSGDEELLKDLLSRIDKSLYMSIFSFNLHGLQNVHSLKSEDLGKFLFSTGTIGSERLLITENHLQKELDSRFKPNGKKPLINEKLKEVKELHQRLRKASLENDEYRTLLLRKEKLLEEVAQGEKQQSALRRQYHRLEEWKKLQPVTEEMKGTENLLKNMGSSDFPIDGISRLEQLNQMLKPTEARIVALTEKRNKLKRQLDRLLPNRAIIEKEMEINQALENLPFYESLREEEKESQRRLKEAETEIQSLKGQLHLPIKNEELLQINTSIFMKEQAEEASRKQIRLHDRKEDLDRAFQQEKESLERVEERVLQLEKRVLSPTERNAKEQVVRKVRNKDVMKKELEGIQEKLAILKTAHFNEKEQNRQKRYQALFLSSFFALLTIWGLWSSQWIIAVGGALGLLFILFTYGNRKKVKNIPDLNGEVQDLEKQEKKLVARLQQASSQEIALLVEELKKDDEIVNELNVAKIHLKQQEEQYEKVIKAYEAWEKETKAHGHLLISLGRELLLPEEVALKHIYDAFNLLAELKERTRDLNHFKETAVEKSAALERIQKEFTALKDYFFSDSQLPLREAIFTLKKRLKDELANRISYEKEEERLRETEEEIERLKSEELHLCEEKRKLFQLAGVDNEEDYRLVGKKKEEQTRLEKKLAELSGQIQLSPLNKEEITQFMEIEDIDEEMEHIQKSIEVRSEQMEKARGLLSDIKHKIELLEDGTEYAELLHRYRQLKSQLDHEAKEWAKFAIAKNFLKKTIERFQNEHLPNMLRKADEYLSFLTEANYVRITPKKDSSGFLIERQDGISFQANELSQATTEAVYVALRLALSATIYKKLPFPIIIDDSFVNFDRIRAERAIELLKSIKNNQILFFTCHSHLLPYFDEQKVILIGQEDYLLEKS